MPFKKRMVLAFFVVGGCGPKGFRQGRAEVGLPLERLLAAGADWIGGGGARSLEARAAQTQSEMTVP